MADVATAIVYAGDIDVVTWETLTSSNAAGVAYEPNTLRGIAATVQVFGTFDSATVIMQGSNNGTTWTALSNPLGTAISLTAAGYAEISTAFRFLRPSTSGGSGSQDVDVILVARG